MQLRARRTEPSHVLTILTALVLLLAAQAAAAQTAPIRLTGRDTMAGDQFGAAIGAYAGTLVVGAPTNNPANAEIPPGAAYVFVRSSATRWVQQAKLVPGGGTIAAGSAVAASGNTVVITTGNPGAAAFVYVRNGTTWTRQARIALAGSPGLKVALDGHRLMLVSENTGIAYAYRRSASGSWSRQQVINPDAGQPGFWSVALSDGRAVLGAQHDSSAASAYVFQRSTVGTGPDRWTKLARVTPTTPESFTLFGWSVDIAQDRILVGAIGEAAFAGAAYVFTRGSNGAWTQTQRLQALPAPRDSGTFGEGVAIHFDRAVIGEPSTRRQEEHELQSVSADVYARSGTTWSRVATMSSGVEGLGGAVALSNCGAFAGSPREDAVYIVPTTTC